MRKNNLFLLLLMALIVMSCSKDETTMGIPQEGNAIEFGTYVGRDAQTRAGIIDATALQTQGFGVFAYYTDGGDYTVGTSTPNFMYNTKVSTADWTYAPIKYWPNETTDKLTFFAYAPHSTTTNSNVSDLSGNTAAGDPTLKFTVNATAKSQSDLLYADATNLKNLGKQSITGKVNFPFKHALSRIGFNVEAMVDIVNGTGTGNPDVSPETGNGAIDDKTKIVVTKVELIGNFYESGVLNLNSTVTTGAPIVSVPNWGTYLPATVTERTFTLNAGTDATASNFASAEWVGPHTSGKTFGQDVTNAKTTLNKADSYIMVIPQNFDGTGTDVATKIKVKVTYDVITKDDDLETGQSKVTNEITSIAFPFNFEHGKAYTFNLHLGMTSVKFDATVSDWGTETGTVVNVPINTGTNP